MTLAKSNAIEVKGLPTDLVEQEQLNTWLELQPPHRVVRWTLDTFGPGLVMTSSFGLNGVALIHMIQEITREVPIVFVDTGYLFKETLETKRRIEAAFKVSVLTFRPSLGVLAQALQYGSDLHIRQPDLCCVLRKIEPMQRAMAELAPAAVLNGRARFQASTRRSLPVVEWEQGLVRINPLATWTQQQIEIYVTAHEVPYNPLYEAGYPSIGCRPCTRPVQKGEDIRAGRWAGLGKTECGLWTRRYTAVS